MLGVEHRLLEPDRVLDHPELLDPDLGRGQDVEVAEAEDPAEERLLEARVVDLLERAVGRGLVEHAGHLHHAAVGDDVLLVQVVQEGPEQDRDPADEDDRHDPAEDVAERCSAVLAAR